MSYGACSRRELPTVSLLLAAALAEVGRGAEEEDLFSGTVQDPSGNPW